VRCVVLIVLKSVTIKGFSLDLSVFACYSVLAMGEEVVYSMIRIVVVVLGRTVRLYGYCSERRFWVCRKHRGDALHNVHRDKMLEMLLPVSCPSNILQRLEFPFHINSSYICRNDDSACTAASVWRPLFSSLHRPLNKSVRQQQLGHYSNGCKVAHHGRCKSQTAEAQSKGRRAAKIL
jgi:hypothetical protein